MVRGKNYGLGTTSFKPKHYKKKKYKGPKLAMGGILKSSKLKIGKRNKLGAG